MKAKPRPSMDERVFVRSPLIPHNRIKYVSNNSEILQHTNFVKTDYQIFLLCACFTNGYLKLIAFGVFLRFNNTFFFFFSVSRSTHTQYAYIIYTDNDFTIAQQ